MNLFQKQFVLLDGATGTSLYRLGMPSDVCVEKWVSEHADALNSIQRAYIDAGSDVIYTPTFGANRVALSRHGLEGSVYEINRLLTEATVKNASHAAKVAGSVTTTGLFVKPYSDTEFDELIDIYTEQIQAIKDGGADYIVGETLMSMSDMRAIILAAKTVGIPCAVSLSVDSNGRTLAGMSPAAAVVTAQSMGAIAFGINCSDGPEDVARAVGEAYPYASIPLFGKPNSGNPSSPIAVEEFISGCAKIIDAGATGIGGCCGTDSTYIKALRTLIDERSASLVLPDCDIIACADSNEAYKISGYPKVTTPVYTSGEYYGVYFDMDWSEFEALTLGLHTPQQAKTASEEAYACGMPIAFYADDAATLESALLHYQGRAVVVWNDAIDEKELLAIAKKYGALIHIP